MKVLSVCMLVVVAVTVNGIASGMQNVPVFAQMAADPDEGGEIKATPSTNEEPSKPSITKKAIPNLKPYAWDPVYKVKVTFTSVTVHNTHEEAPSGGGEYDLSVYVHGKLVSLLDLSRKAGGDGLWDVSKGETVMFPAGSEITVDIAKTLPLSIFTVGSEIDGCDRTAFPVSVQDKLLFGLGKGINYLIPVGDIQNSFNMVINYIGCKLNPNDNIGNIKQVNNPTGYGAGPHTDVSDKKDFTLRYTISATPHPPLLAIK